MNILTKLFIASMALIIMIMINPSMGQAADIVNPKQTYTYEIMVKDIKALAQKYPKLIKYKTIGNSEYGRPIYAVSLGTGNAKVFINGSHHAREWITTNLNMNMIEKYAKTYAANETFGGYNVRKVLDETTIWFVPMVNPDGVTLQQFGLSKFSNNIHSSLIKMNEGSTDFKRWKANAKGIDLNRQYQADWANIKNNYTYPRWSNHKGSKPEQAVETKALVNFTKEINPEMTVAYHSSGEILYWNFNQTGTIYTRDHKYAEKLRQLTGYQLVYPGSNPSGGGYTDWFISAYKRPGFTPEVSPYVGNTHVPLSKFDSIWEENKYVGLYTASEGYKLYLARGGKPKAQEVNVKINGNPISFEQPALLINGNTLIPIRGVFEELGATLEWDPKTYGIIAKKGTTLVELKVDSKMIKVNGVEKTLDIAPQIINDHTLIPLRAVSEALGAEVGWEQSTNTALITLTPQESDIIPPSKPVINPMSDVTLSISGKSETNATILIKKEDGSTAGQLVVGANGQFSIKVGAQKANTVFLITATDMAGNTSELSLLKISYTNKFTDTIGHWAQEPLGYLKDNKITTGYPDGSFGISKNISRAEAATFLVRALQLDTENITNLKIPDVPENHYFYKQIATIFNQGIMKGFPSGDFKPDHTLTRAEMATILVNAFNLSSKGNKTSPDVNKNHWAYEAINIVTSNGLAEGYPDGTYKPENAIQRAEFGALLARVLQLASLDNDQLSDNDNERNSDNLDSIETNDENNPSDSNAESQVQTPEAIQNEEMPS